MRFGDYIRDKRQAHRWTQPEAAKLIGIEQSYLSKLESGKSYPSEDVFASLMAAYKIDLAALNDTLFPADLDRLREISEVRNIILHNEKDRRKRARSWLLAGILALTLGGACLGASLLAEDTDITEFQYRSQGVTYDDEFGHSAENRIDEKYKSLEDYRVRMLLCQFPLCLNPNFQFWRNPCSNLLY